MTEIIQDGHPTLRATSSVVPVEDIASPQIRDIIARMHEALASQSDGVALAAPQINESVRIFVVSSDVFSLPDSAELVYINPSIVDSSPETLWVDEGCLSVRWKYGKTKRSPWVTVEAYDEHGNRFTKTARGLLAQIFQHEIDHLDGILFTDHAIDVSDYDPE